VDKIHESKSKEYVYLNQLPIDKLLELLTVAPVLSTCPEDEAYVDALEEVIVEKELENSTGLLPDVDQQWEQFLTFYLPDEDEPESEPEAEYTEHAVSAQRSPRCPETSQTRVVRLRQVWRIALIAAVVAVCTLGAMFTAQAAGIDVFGAMAKWSQGIFSFGQISMKDEKIMGNKTEPLEQKFSSLQEALDAYGITEVHEPTWLPSGYVFKEVDALCTDDPFFQLVPVSYMNGDYLIDISIKYYDDEPDMQVEKTDALIKTIKMNGITYYLIENIETGTIAWYTDQYEYYISCPKEEMDILWKIADSMVN